MDERIADGLLLVEEHYDDVGAANTADELRAVAPFIRTSRGISSVLNEWLDDHEDEEDTEEYDVINVLYNQLYVMERTYEIRLALVENRPAPPLPPDPDLAAIARKIPRRGAPPRLIPPLEEIIQQFEAPGEASDDEEVPERPRMRPSTSTYIGVLTALLLRRAQHRALELVAFVPVIGSPRRLLRLERALGHSPEFDAAWGAMAVHLLGYQVHEPRRLLLIVSALRHMTVDVLADALVHAAITGVRVGSKVHSLDDHWLALDEPIHVTLGPSRGEFRPGMIVDSGAIPPLSHLVWHIEGRATVNGPLRLSFRENHVLWLGIRALPEVAPLVLDSLYDLPRLDGDAPTDPTLAWIERLARDGRDSSIGRLTAWALGVNPGPPPSNLGQFWDTARDDVRWL